MPYFKSADGRGRGHISDERAMDRLEEWGYVRLAGKELYVRIVWKGLKKFGIPAACALAAFHFSNEFLIGLIVFSGVQEILN